MAFISYLRHISVSLLLMSGIATAAADSILDKARAAYSDGEYDAAINLVEEGLRQTPNDFNLMELSVYSHLLKADRTVDDEVARSERYIARDAARLMTRQHPDSAQSYIVLGDLDLEFNDYESAIANAEIARRLGSPRAASLKEEAIWRRDSGIHRGIVSSLKVSEKTDDSVIREMPVTEDVVTQSKTKIEEVVVEYKEERHAEPETIFRAVEQMPEFPGGQEALLKYVNSSIQYPPQAAENGIEGRVVVQFVVEKDGSVGEVRIGRSITKDLDREAARVCKSLPKFIPGRQNGQPVRVWFTLPVTFSLQNAKGIK